MSDAGAGLPILNLREATFDCTYGRGCDGIHERYVEVFGDERGRLSPTLTGAHVP